MPDWADEKARHIARPIRGCATDEQYVELIDATAAALRAARDEGIDAAWEAAYSVMSNETNASQRRVSKAIHALKHKEPRR